MQLPYPSEMNETKEKMNYGPHPPPVGPWGMPTQRPRLGVGSSAIRSIKCGKDGVMG